MVDVGQFWECAATYATGDRINASITFTVGKYL